MQGLVFDIKRFALHDGPGTRTTIFLKGCPLSCWWCHNPESISSLVESYVVEEKLGPDSFFSTKVNGKQMTVPQVMEEVSKELIFMEESGGGLTLSGGEPMQQFDFSLQLLKEAKKLGIHTAIDTSGFTSMNKLESIAEYVDLFLYDFKLFNQDLHQHYCGVDNTLIKANLEHLIQRDQKIIVRIPVIPSVNFGSKEEQSMLQYLSSIKGKQFDEVHLLPFHSIGRSKYTKFCKEERMEGRSDLVKEDLKALAEAYKSAGFKVVVH